MIKAGTDQTDMTVTPDVPFNKAYSPTREPGRLRVKLNFGPRQIRSKFRWTLRQLLVYGCMPLKPVLEMALKHAYPGY